MSIFSSDTQSWSMPPKPLDNCTSDNGVTSYRSAAANQSVDEHLVGQHVQLLLLFTLHEKRQALNSAKPHFLWHCAFHLHSLNLKHGLQGREPAYKRPLFSPERLSRRPAPRAWQDRPAGIITFRIRMLLQVLTRLRRNVGAACYLTLLTAEHTNLHPNTMLLRRMVKSPRDSGCLVCSFSTNLVRVMRSVCLASAAGSMAAK